MSTTFDGPIRVGEIRDTTGTTLGLNVKNTGIALVSQQVPIDQTATTVSTTIVVPKGSAIHDIRVLVTSPWTGASATLGVGTSGNATFFTAAGAVTTGTIGVVAATPGADAVRTGNFINTGAQDVRVVVTNANTGTGVGAIMVTYAPNLNIVEPTI